MCLLCGPRADLWPFWATCGSTDSVELLPHLTKTAVPNWFRRRSIFCRTWFISQVRHMSGSASEPNLTLKCCGSILVRDHIPWANTKSLHFWWSLTGGSTVSDYVSHFKGHNIIVYVFVIWLLEFQWNWCKQRWLCISWGDPRNKIWRSSATSGWSSGRRRGRRGGNRSIRAPWRRRRKITDWRFTRWGWKNGSYSHWTLMNT